jgi:cell division protein FtsB
MLFSKPPKTLTVAHILRQKKLTTSLLVLVVVLQIPVWFTKGGWFGVWRQQAELVKLQQSNIEQGLKNAQLKADVEELADQGRGQAAIEERARYNLGMLKTDEVFVQFVQK